MGLFAKPKKPTQLTEEILNFQWREFPTKIDQNIEALVQSIPQLTPQWFTHKRVEYRVKGDKVIYQEIEIIQLAFIDAVSVAIVQNLVENAYVQNQLASFIKILQGIDQEIKTTDAEVTKELLGILSGKPELVTANYHNGVSFSLPPLTKIFDSSHDPHLQAWRGEYKKIDEMRNSFAAGYDEFAHDVRNYLENFIHAYFIEQIKQGGPNVQKNLTTVSYSRFHDQLMATNALTHMYLFLPPEIRGPDPNFVPASSVYQQGIMELALEWSKPEP